MLQEFPRLEQMDLAMLLKNDLEADSVYFLKVWFLKFLSAISELMKKPSYSVFGNKVVLFS